MTKLIVNLSYIKIARDQINLKKKALDKVILD